MAVFSAKWLIFGNWETLIKNWEVNFDFFRKNFGDKNFLFIMFSIDCFNFSCMEQFSNCFFVIFWKNEKNAFFFEKTCGFYTYFEIVFWLQRGALKNGTPSFGCNLYDFCWYKSFLLILKNIFLKFWNDYTHVAHFFMLCHFGKMDILQKYPPPIFSFIFVASSLFTIIFQIFLLKYLIYFRF